MAKPLAGCRIHWPLEFNMPVLPEIYESLCYQVNVLGGNVILDHARAVNGFDFYFSFEKRTSNNTSMTAPSLERDEKCNDALDAKISCIFVNSEDFEKVKSGIGISTLNWESKKPVFSEFTAQAYCGLMSVHGRSIGELKPLGINYLSAVCASFCIQSVVAEAVRYHSDGRLGSEFERSFNERNESLYHLFDRTVVLSLEAVGLLCVAQYIAGATAEEMPEKIMPQSLAKEYRPPFVSSDGVHFEIEVLAPERWKLFWNLVLDDLNVLGLGDSYRWDEKEVGRSWKSFMLRYPRATSPISEKLFRGISALTFNRIFIIANDVGISIIKVRSLEERASDPDTKQLLNDGPWCFYSPSLASNQAGSEKKYLERKVNATFQISKDMQCGIGNEENDKGLPLLNNLVVESCRRIQGPLAGHILKRFGADVIRIEPLGGDPLRDMPPLAGGISARFFALNDGKKIQEVDIKSIEGKQYIRDLVSGAHIFIQNWAPGKAEELDLAANHLHEVNDKLVYAYAGGFSPDAINNIDGVLLGTDFSVQAFSGVAHSIGNSGDIQGGTLFTALDILGGVLSSQGAVLSLFNQSRDSGNRNCTVESSLLGAASLLLSGPLTELLSANETIDNQSTEGVPFDENDAFSEKNFEFCSDRIRSIFSTATEKIAMDIRGRNSVSKFFEVIDIPIPNMDELSKIKGLEENRYLAEVEFHLSMKTAEEWKAHFDYHNLVSSIVLENLSLVSSKERFKAYIEHNQFSKVIDPWLFVSNLESSHG